MNLKLITFFLASGVMQTHGQYGDIDFGFVNAVNPGLPDEIDESKCLLDVRYVPRDNVLACAYDATNNECRICTFDISTHFSEEVFYNYCKDNPTDDWKWNPNSERGNTDPGPPTRHLRESDVLALLSSSCVETFYKISIMTIGEYGHIGCIAEPSCNDADYINACVDCPSYVFHANLDAEHPDALQKIVEEVVLVDDKENYKHDIYHEIDYLYELQELLVAFKDVELDDNESYNLMYNNCGTFLIKMAHNLGIDPTDPDIINSVAKMLSPTTKVGAVMGGNKYMARFIENYVHSN